jgi:hypothetical protein
MTGTTNPSGSLFSNAVSTIRFTPIEMTWYPDPKLDNATFTAPVYQWPTNLTGQFPTSVITVDDLGTSGVPKDDCTPTTFVPGSGGYDNQQGTLYYTSRKVANILLFAASMIVPETGARENFGQYYGVM